MDLRLDLPFCIGFCSLRRQQQAIHVIANPYEERFFPSARSMSLSACYRQVLTWLFQDLVL